MVVIMKIMTINEKWKNNNNETILKERKKIMKENNIMKENE
jgi:hypothetical protein